ncbi:MAG TPA: AAA family ATPase [Actinomycetota bacterium]|nr:AAA family ATPase [Actinomycetota bacterium]
MSSTGRTLTFLFTDIEGSTKLLRSTGDAYGEIVADHHRILRDAIARGGGTEVGTEGDAFFAVFESAPGAVLAAASAQKELQGHAWPGGLEPKVRMGLHTGEALAVGDNYGGIDVHRAARIAGSAHGGQVVLSDATRILTKDALPEGVTFVDLGAHRLKDIERPEHLFQLAIEGLPSGFPPLKSLDARPNNLPHVLGRFVPRNKEVGDVVDLLRGRRLVTLTGPGGTGKTRLAIEIGHTLLEEFPDGVFFVPLAALSDPALVVPAVAEALNVREQGTRPVHDVLLEYLQAKDLLLILDNFEQISGAAADVADVLAGAPRLKVLVTSRSPLRIYGEQEYAVPTMQVAEPSTGPSYEEIAASQAALLFVERARAVDPSFMLTRENAPAVAAICARLDGLPLAIELAAARVRLFDPADLAGRLERSVSFLTSGARDLPSRQRTLRGAIAWSYDLLDEPAQAFFARLGVFAGGWNIDALDTVTDSDALGVDVLDELEALVEGNLVRRVPVESGGIGFRMLQTIRDFALDQLEARGELDSTRKRHAAFYLALAEKAEPELTRATRWTERLSAEHDNVRAALNWYLSRGETSSGLRLASSLWRFWQVRSHLGEADTWLTRFLDRHEEHDAARAKALAAVGSIAYWRNDFERCARYYGEALDAYRELGDDAGIAESLYNIAFVGLIEGRLDEARGRFEESRHLYRKHVDERGLAGVTWGLAMVAFIQGDLAAARHLAQDAHRLYTTLDDWFGRALTEHIFVHLAKKEGRYDEAVAAILEQMERSFAGGDLLTLLSAAESLADIEVKRGGHRRAVTIAAAAASLRRDAGGGAPPPLMLTEGDVRERAAPHLSATDLEEAWREGEAMALDELVAFMSKGSA